MNYHLVFCIKYRRKVIDDPMSDRLKEIFERIGANYKITLVEQDTIVSIFTNLPRKIQDKNINTSINIKEAGQALFTW